MTHDWDRTEGWFHRLVSLDARGREAGLAELTGEDPGLAEEVRELLSAHDAKGVVDHLEATLVRPPWWSHDQDDLTGGEMGPYRLEGLVARGGMGDVYRGRDTRIGREVAIKLLPPWSVRDPAAEERFLAEARAISMLDHTNICVLLEADRTGDGRLFLVTPFYPGETLQARLERGPLSPAMAADIGCQVARGLAAAHERGVIHRDIKPSNLLITDGGRVKILDFGVAKLTDHTVTRPGHAPGTLAYMSPEQMAGAEVDPRTDLWSLGVVLHEMLTGRRLPGGFADAARGSGGAGGDSPSPAVPPALAAVVERLLRPAPGERYSDAREVAAALSALDLDRGGRAGSGTTKVAQTPAVRGRRLMAIASGLVLLAILGVVGILGPTAENGPRASLGAIRTVAVLPPASVDPDPGHADLALGLHRALIEELGRTTDLAVISLESALRFQESGLGPEAVGRELGAQAAVRVSIVTLGDSTSLSAQLLGAESGQEIVSWSFVEASSDLVQLQRDAAVAIARAVGASIRGEAGGTPTRLINPRAQDAYFRGLGELSRQYMTLAMLPDEREAAIRAAIASLEEATRIDPDWAEAHGKLALAYHFLASGFEGRFEAEYYPLSKESALRALILDPEEPQALASLGFVLYQYDREWAAAEDHIVRSLELGSNAHGIHALLLNNGGRPEEAVAAFQRALEINPLLEFLRQQYAANLHCAGRHEEAIALVESYLPSVAPPGRYGTYWPRSVLARSYSALGRHPEALALAEQSVLLSDSTSRRLADLAYVRSRAGDADGARELIARLEERDQDWMARAALAELGETERAVAAVERTMAENPRHRFAFACEPEYPLLRDHPRIQEIVRREGYPGLASSP